MTFEDAVHYTDESLRHCKEILTFLKKKQTATQEYARNLSKVVPSPIKSPSEKIPAEKSVNENSHLRRVFQELNDGIASIADVHKTLSNEMGLNVIESFSAFIKEFEATKKANPDKGLEFSKNLQDALGCLKKAQKDYDIAQTSCLDLQTTVAKAKKTEMKEKDLEKLSAKLNIVTEKSNHAAETLRVHEEIARNAQEHFYKQVKPGLNQDLKTKEQELCENTKKVLQEYIQMERQTLELQLSVVDALCDKINAVDILEDLENFVVNCLNDDLNDGEDFSPRGLINSAKRGKLLMKTGDTNSGWKSKYLVLMPEGKLYIYDQEDALNPKAVFELQACSVYFLHDSYFDRPYCLQIVVDGTKLSTFDLETAYTELGVKRILKDAYNFAAESAQDRETWTQFLRYFISCCPKCEIMYGSRAAATGEVALQGFESINEQYREIRSIKVSICEAKEIPTLPSTKVLSPYAEILFDDVKCARTGIKSGDCPLWGEEFEFDDIDPHHNRLRVLLNHSDHSSKVPKDVDIGYVTVNMMKLQHDQSTEIWYPLKIFQRTGVEMTACSMRLIVEMKHEHILPIGRYKGFIHGLMRPGLRVICVLSNTLGTKKNELANLIINIASAYNKDIEVLKTLLDYDISRTEDPNIVFRGNTIATKALDKYMKLIGTEYLHSTIGPLLRTIGRSKDSCEVDPLRTENPEVRKKNSKRLLNFVSLIWDAIFKSADVVPPELISIFSFIRQALMKKFPNKYVHYAGISGFLFLRFFCPAILGPKLFGIMNEYPDGVAARTLTLSAKIMQNLANLSLFGNKEPHMTEFNAYITDNIPYMQIFLDKLSTYPDIHVEPTTNKSSMVLRRSAEALYRLFESHTQFMIENREEVSAEDFEAFSSAMIDLSANHIEYKTKYAILPKGKDAKKNGDDPASASASAENIASEPLPANSMVGNNLPSLRELANIAEAEAAEKVKAMNPAVLSIMKEGGRTESADMRAIQMSPLPDTPVKNSEVFLVEGEEDASDLLQMHMNYSAYSENKLSEFSISERVNSNRISMSQNMMSGAASTNTISKVTRKASLELIRMSQLKADEAQQKSSRSDTSIVVLGEEEDEDDVMMPILQESGGSASMNQRISVLTRKMSKGGPTDEAKDGKLEVSEQSKNFRSRMTTFFKT